MKDQRDGPLSETTEVVVPEPGQVAARLVGRDRAGRTPGGSTRLELDDAVPARRITERGLERVFRARAEALGMRVTETSRADLRPVLDRLVSRYGVAVVEPALIATFPELDGLGDSTPDDPRLTAASCGVTGVEYAIAETGGLVVASGASRWRQFSSVPPVHVAVIESGKLVPDLLDVLLAYGGRNLPPGFVVLTGPSRTAENGQTWGPHGPGTVECVLVD